MTAAGAGTFEQAFHDANQAISRGIEDVQSNFKLLEERLNRALKFIYIPGVSEAIIAGFRQAADLTNDFMDLLQRFLTEPGYPPALFRIGDMWETDVGQKLSELAAKMAPSERAAVDSFSGSAARAYERSAEAQRLATQSFMPLSTSVKGQLHELAHSQIVFLLAIGAALVTVVVGIVAAAVSAGSVVGAPAAPPIVVAAAAGAITMLAGAAPIIYDAYSQFEIAINTFKSELADSEGMPGNQWPKVGESVINPRRPWQVATD
ncbi:hypothetical protein GCM10010112_47950 [Actinoplanes lobatus]|uniref:Uncharacterized protein n=1 Tax=Actinoplanes lobatus TaxID=113568 RepID=A0A7W7MGU1_9ACTN|nr:hypothetical protein [Actinoplanes lobatus]MBB4749749.1 hypothetical protein [Actinoplanes lobatus]GGN76079.1 hypothetical protein GCM10010112_47950 [Actinoplanes lobatus]GIE38487.1 hypothetical protein Alo02nite_13850 [Actinoplanes lobatus]